MGGEIVRAVGAAAERLSDAGCVVSEIGLAFMRQRDWLRVFLTLWLAETIPYVGELARGREDELHAVGAALFAAAPPATADRIEAEAALIDLRLAFARYFDAYDVLLCPVNPTTAPYHGQRRIDVEGVSLPAVDVMRMTSPFNLTGLPAISAPFTETADGLPINVQLVGRANEESTILRLAALLERTGNLGDQHPEL